MYRPLLILLLTGCTPILDLDGPHQICVADGGCEQSADVPVAAVDCDAPCERFASCAKANCVSDLDALRQTCSERCSEIDGIAETLASADTCAEVLELGAPDALGSCIGDRCDAFAGRLTGCIVAECAAAGEVFDGLHVALRSECAVDVSDRTLLLSTLDDLSADACGAAGWSGRVEAALAGNGPGALSTLCISGPAFPATVCRDACAMAEGCDLAALETCRFACATVVDDTGTYPCLEQADGCDEAALCVRE